MSESIEKYPIEGLALFERFYSSMRAILQTDVDKDIAGALGLSPQRFANQKTRGTIPLAAIIQFCQDRNVSLDEVFGLATSRMAESHAFIPLIDVYAEGGLAGYFGKDFPEKIDLYPFKRKWLASKGYASEDRLRDLHLIKVRGDSMFPTIDDGELVLVDRNISVRLPDSIRKTGIYIIRWGTSENTLSAKRIHLDWSEYHIIATSDNPLYTPKHIRVEMGRELQEYIFGKVIWIGKENV